MLTKGLFLLVITGSSYGTGCYGPAISDICQTQEPQIPELQSRDPSTWLTNVTAHWTYCDLYAITLTQWYKSTWNMTTTCPGKYKCGTRFPIWMNGSNPGVSEGIVYRTACMLADDDSCAESYGIAAVNCGQFMAYCFNQELSVCPMRYCFDLKQTASTTSSNTASTSNDRTPTSGYTDESSSTSYTSTQEPTSTFVPNGRGLKVHNDRSLITTLMPLSVLLIVAVTGLIIAIVRYMRNAKVEDLTKDTIKNVAEENKYEKLAFPGVYATMTDYCVYTADSYENDGYIVPIGIGATGGVTKQTDYTNTADPKNDEEHYQTLP